MGMTDIKGYDFQTSLTAYMTVCFFQQHVASWLSLKTRSLTCSLDVALNAAVPDCNDGLLLLLQGAPPAEVLPLTPPCTCC